MRILTPRNLFRFLFGAAVLLALVFAPGPFAQAGPLQRIKERREARQSQKSECPSCQSVAPSAPRAQTVGPAASGSCPGGNCPAPSQQRQRFSLFR